MPSQSNRRMRSFLIGGEIILRMLTQLLEDTAESVAKLRANWVVPDFKQALIEGDLYQMTQYRRDLTYAGYTPAAIYRLARQALPGLTEDAWCKIMMQTTTERQNGGRLSI